MDAPRLIVERLDTELPLPRYANPGDAGIDLHSAHDVTIVPGERVVVGTGIAIAIPHGYVGLCCPRSGTAAAKGLSMVNTPGIVDSGYRGEVKLVLVNLDAHVPIEIARGDRIAQMVVVPVAAVEIIESDALPDSPRGTDGFGSTGR